MPLRFSSSSALSLFLLLFALSAALGVLPAYDAGLSTATLMAVFAGVGLYFVIAYGPRDRSSVRVAAAIGMLTALALALYFIGQYGHLNYEKGGILSRLGELTTFLPDLGGFTPHPNAAATFMEVALPLGLALAWSGRSTRTRALWAICSFIIAYAVFLTASRGSWLALGLTAALAMALTVLNRLPRRAAALTIVVGGLVLVAGLAVILALGPERLPLLASTFWRAFDRGRLFQNSLHLASDYAFTGIGLGDTFALLYSRYVLMIQAPFLTYAHNLPLSVWLNQGLLGLTAFLGVVAAFYLFAYRVYGTRPSRLFHGAWLGVTVTLLHGLTDAPQYADSRWVMPMWLAWMGLAVASGRLTLRDTRPALHSPVRARRLLTVAAALLIALVLVFNRPLLALWHTNLGAVAEARAELNERLAPEQRDAENAVAVAEYRNALDLDPSQPNANRRLGNLLVKLDRLDEAVPFLEAAFAADPARDATIKGLGLAYVWVGRLDDAVRIFRLLEDAHDMPEELLTWGFYRSENDRPLLAAYAYETAILLDGRSKVEVWLLAADAYRAADQVDAAGAWYNRVLAVDPDNERATRALNQIGSQNNH